MFVGLTDTDILINSIIFMTAGFDTTATTLGWLTYDLALNPDVQDKLIDEIDAEIGKVCYHNLPPRLLNK